MKLNSIKALFLVASSLMLLPNGTRAYAEDLTEEQIIQRAVEIAVKKASKVVVKIDTLGDLREGFRAKSKKQGVLAKKGFKQAYGPSTGTIVSPDGYIITSSFTLRNKPRHIFVTTDDGRQFVAKLVGQDQSRGIALLKVSVEKALPAVPILAKKDIKAGQFSIAIGYGYGGKSANVSVGIVSAKDRISGKALQASPLISPANYGGVLASIDGRIMGIIVPLTSSGRMAGVDFYDCGIGFAIPRSDLEGLLPRLMRGEDLKAGFLGVMADQKKTDGGITIKEIVRRSPADRAGLKAGDIITGVAGRKVKNFFEFFNEIGSKVAGEKVVVKYLRDGVERQVEVTLANRPKQAPKAPNAGGAVPVDPPAPKKDDHDHDGDGKPDHGPGEHGKDSEDGKDDKKSD
jgi:serine protease Do